MFSDPIDRERETTQQIPSTCAKGIDAVQTCSTNFKTVLQTEIPLLLTNKVQDSWSSDEAK